MSSNFKDKMLIVEFYYLFIIRVYIIIIIHNRFYQPKLLLVFVLF